MYAKCTRCGAVDYICDCDAVIDKDLQTKLAAARACLKEIMEHEHCEHPTRGNHAARDTDNAFARQCHYEGVMEGHRCCAAIAAKGLEESK